MERIAYLNFPDLATAARELPKGWAGSFNAPSLDNAGDWTIDRHDVFQNDDDALIVKRRYSYKPLNLTAYRIALATQVQS